MTHFAIHTDDVPDSGNVLTGFMPSASVGDDITIIASDGLAYGEVVEKDLPGYEAVLCGSRKRPARL